MDLNPQILAAGILFLVAIMGLLLTAGIINPKLPSHHRKQEPFVPSPEGRAILLAFLKPRLEEILGKERVDEFAKEHWDHEISHFGRHLLKFPSSEWNTIFEYLHAGGTFATAVYNHYDFEQFHQDYITAEEAYAKLGYKQLLVGNFFKWTIQELPLEGMAVRLKPTETPILHAKLYHLVWE